MMTQSIWLKEEISPRDEAVMEEMDRTLQPAVEGTSRSIQRQYIPTLAVRMQDIIIYNTRQWFGEADIRLDALVIHGNGIQDQPTSFYMPRTFPFSRILKGDRLPTGDTGLLVFLGKARYFLDIFITISRDRENADNLAHLLDQQLSSEQFKKASATVLELTTIAAPQAATITAAASAALTIGNIAYQVLRATTGNTIGLFHTSWLQYTDGFGVGRHPEIGVYTEKDFSFWYEIILEGKHISGR
jgi:hypothetical protein